MIEGASGSVSFVVDEASTALALGSGDVPVLGTPKVVALAEEAAVAAITGDIDRGQTSVGITISMEHRAPTGIGGRVDATATVTRLEGRTVFFSIVVRHGDEVVAFGDHTRVIVDRARFLARG